MAIETKVVCICDICGYMVESKEVNQGLDHNIPDDWSHGRSGLVDICPNCAKKLKKPTRNND